jgi:tetratricopeptide (TPR) repeat protein
MFRRGIGLHPTWWFGHNELGSLFWRRGRYDDALREFNEVIRLDPQNSWGYSNSGAVLVTKGRLDDAVAMFKKATSLSEDAGAHVNLGYCYFFLGQYDKAAESNQTAVRLRGSFSSYWVELGDACAWSSKYQKEAVPAYETAAQRAKAELEVNPKSPRAHATLAIALARTGDLAHARQSIRRAMDLDPENPEHFFRAARIANLDGHSEEAVSWLKRALDAGSSRLELERHPEFAQLRQTKAVQELLNKRPQT